MSEIEGSRYETEDVLGANTWVIISGLVVTVALVVPGWIS